MVSTRHGLGLVAALTLAACGGGGDSAPPPVTPPTPTSITLSGTAAQGAALPGAAVSVKCAGGTGTATTGTDGKYTLTISAATLPCALKVVGTNAATFHSLLAGTTGGSFTANISPLTELLVARAAGALPPTYFANFAAGTAPSAAAVTQAINALKAMTAGLIDLTGTNPITDELMASNGGTAGNALDLKIDALVLGISNAQTTLAAVTAAIVANPNSPDVIGSVLAPVAATCTALRGGKYRIINPYETDPDWKHHVMTIDAVALTATSHDGGVITITANGNCLFTTDSAESTDTVMVAPSGILVIYSQLKSSATLRSVAIGLPEQALPVSELAGTWNVIDWDPHSGSQIAGYVGSTPVVTLDATGQVTAISRCLGLAACVPDAGPFIGFTANTASGGFERKESGVSVAQLFLYKTLGDRAAFVLVAEDGEMLVGTRQEAFTALPAVGSATNFREFQFNGNGSISTLLDQTVTVTAVDATARTVTRIRASDGRVDTLGYDQPRAGMRYRPPNSCTINGAAFNCSETAQLVLQGMGITLSVSVSTAPTNAFLAVSVNKPS